MPLHTKSTLLGGKSTTCWPTRHPLLLVSCVPSFMIQASSRTQQESTNIWSNGPSGKVAVIHSAWLLIKGITFHGTVKYTFFIFHEPGGMLKLWTCLET